MKLASRWESVSKLPKEFVVNMNAHKMFTNSSSTPASPTLNAVSITHVSHSGRYTVVPNNRFILCSSSNDTEHVSGDWGPLKTYLFKCCSIFYGMTFFW